MAIDAVAALHLCDGGGGVGGRAQGVRMVPHAAAELDIVLTPVPPQNCLDLSAFETSISLTRFLKDIYHVSSVRSIKKIKPYNDGDLEASSLFEKVIDENDRRRLFSICK